MIDNFVAWAYYRHLWSDSHNSDYEVCRDVFCRFAYWLEVVGIWKSPTRRRK